MKISIIAIVILLLTLTFFLFGQVVDDFNVNYGNTSISPAGEFNTTLISDFDDLEALNNATAPIQEGFEQISTSDGFLNVLGNFAIVLPKAIIAVPSVIFTVAVLGKQRLEDVLVLLGIGPQIIDIALLALAIIVIFAVVAFWHRRAI